MICGGFLCGGSLAPLLAEDDWVVLPGQKSESEGAERNYIMEGAYSANGTNGAIGTDAISAAEGMQGVTGGETEYSTAGLIAAATPKPASDADMTDAGSEAGMPQVPGAEATPTPATDADIPGTGDEAGMPQFTAAPTPAPVEEMPEAGDETPPPKPTPAPQSAEQPALDNNIEPPLPSSASTEEVAEAVPLPANPALQQQQFSEWDLARVESPMFMSESINDFSERPVYLTGNWSVNPHLSIGFIYDGNIFLRHQNVQGDFITRFAPGVTMRLGNTESMFYLVADYTAGVDWYMTHSSQTTVDQDATATLQWNLPKTTITMRLGIFDDTGQDIDVTDRVRQTQYYAGATAHYAYGEKTSLDVSSDYTRSDFGHGLISSSQVEGQTFLNYEYSPQTQLGAGATMGYVWVPGGVDQEFEQANLRATYKATGKLTVIGEVGAEFRQYSGGEGQTVTPVFNLEGAWAVREGTEIDLTLQREIFASAILQDQDYTSTSVDLTIRQRIGDRVTALLTGGYVNAVYSAAATGVTGSRVDNFYYIRPAIQWQALKWLSVGIFYQFSEDISHGATSDSFTWDRGGVDIAILF